MKPSKYLIEKTKNAKKPKNLKKITSDLYIDWSQVPDPIPLTKKFFTTPLKFDINEIKKDNENVA